MMSMNCLINCQFKCTEASLLGDSGTKMWFKCWDKISTYSFKFHHQYYQLIGPKRVSKTWCRKLLLSWVIGWTVVSIWIFCYMSSQATEKRRETLASMCDERARMLQDQFNVSMNHIQAMSILISTFHHGKNPSAIDQVSYILFPQLLVRIIELVGIDKYAFVVLDSMFTLLLARFKVIMHLLCLIAVVYSFLCGGA